MTNSPQPLGRWLARITASLIASSLAAVASAGTLMASQIKDLSDNSLTTQEMKAENDVLRMDTMRKQTAASTILFKNNALYMIDHKEKTYHVIDEATMAKMGKRMAEARQQMQARMAAMPPEQRAMMEKMMAKMGGPKAAPAEERTQYVRTSRAESFAGIKCQIWEGKTGGAKTDEVCIAAKGSVPSASEIFGGLKHFAATMQKFVGSMGVKQKASDNPWRDLEQFDGFPIAHRDYDAGKLRTQMELTALRASSFPAGTFEVPANYKLKAMDFGAR